MDARLRRRFSAMLFGGLSIMSDRRNRPPNRWGCKPDGDVCVEHDTPLECRHGCKHAGAHSCKELVERKLFEPAYRRNG